jgi:hypothetical protein
MAAASRIRVHGERSLVDAEGRKWRVREVDTIDLPGNGNRRCLIFETSELMRRIWHYPERWFALPDEDLLEIGQGRP